MNLKTNKIYTCVCLFLILPFLFSNGALASELACRQIYREQTKENFSLPNKKNFMDQLRYNTRAEYDPRVIHLREVAWKALTNNVDLLRILNHFIDKSQSDVFRYILSDVMVESAGHYDWKAINENPEHDNYNWAVTLILEKTVVMANNHGYSPPTILSKELSAIEMRAIELLKVGGKYMFRLEHNNILKLRTHNGDVFIYQWDQKIRKWVRQ